MASLARGKVSRNVLLIMLLAASLGLLGYSLGTRADYWRVVEVPGQVVKISQSGAYNAFPKVAWAQGNESTAARSLLAVWYGGDSHVDSRDDGKIYGSTSTTDGQSWGAPRVIYDDPTYDCRNIGLVRAPNGTLVLFFAKVDGHARPPGTSYSHTWVDFGWVASHDGGGTWSAYQSLSALLAGRGFISGNGYGDGVVAGGTVYALCYGYPNASFPETHGAFLLASPNNGATWEWRGNVSLGTGTSTSEADCLHAPAGLFGFSRTQGSSPRILHYIESRDLGQAWDAPQPTNIEGDCPDVFPLSNGDYLVTIRSYTPTRYCYTGYFVLPATFGSATTTAAQRQQCYTSIEEKCLVKNNFGQKSGDVAYASLARLPHGQVLAVYYDVQAGGVFGKIIAESAL